MTTSNRYHPVSRVLHWVIAGLIVLQFVLAKLAERAEQSESAVSQLALLANHKSVGITVLLLVIVRLIWRWRTPPPPLPPTMQRWQVVASNISHWALYGLIIVLPISGWLMSSASAYSVSWFNLIQLPDFVAPDTDLKEQFKAAHELLAKILLVLAAIHLIAALKHHVIDKDGVLRRMTTPISIALFVLVIVAGVSLLGRTSEHSSSMLHTPGAVVGPAAVSESSLSAWTINYPNSHIRFTGDQAGAEFDGEWQKWTAIIQFDENNLPDSRFDVAITTANVSTQDEERDTTLHDVEWFDPKTYPTANYRASIFSANDDGSFTAHGELTIKGNTVAVPLIFSVSLAGDELVLSGQADVLRLNLGVGMGEWEDTTWVSDEVAINVRVSASVN